MLQGWYGLRCKMLPILAFLFPMSYNLVKNIKPTHLFSSILMIGNSKSRLQLR